MIYENITSITFGDKTYKVAEANPDCDMNTCCQCDLRNRCENGANNVVYTICESELCPSQCFKRI